MNGDLTAEQWAQQASHAAQRASQRAEAATNAVIECQLAVARIERETNQLRSEVKVGLVSIREQIAKLATQPAAKPTAMAHTILQEEDWEDSPTGNRKMVSRKTFERWQREREMTDDARKWRALWRKARWAVFAGAGAAGIKAIELLVKMLFHHI